MCTQKTDFVQGARLLEADAAPFACPAELSEVGFIITHKIHDRE